MIDQIEHLTIADTTGRKWTITYTRTVSGFRWHVYVHRVDNEPDVLELFYPGGVAHGWTEADEDRARPLLVSWMAFFDAAPSDVYRDEQAKDMRDRRTLTGEMIQAVGDLLAGVDS